MPKIYDVGLSARSSCSSLDLRPAIDQHLSRRELVSNSRQPVWPSGKALVGVFKSMILFWLVKRFESRRRLT